MKVKSLSRVQLFVTAWTVAHQAPLSMGFSRQEYWSGLPFPSPGDLPNPGIEPRSPALQADAGRCFNLWATREAHQQIKDAANSSDMSQSESLGFTRKWEVKDEWSQGVKEESEEGGKFQKTMRKGINDKGGVNWGNGWASQISCKRGAKCWPPLLIKAVTSLRRVKFYLILDWPHLVSTLTPEPGKTWVTYHSSVTQISPILPSSTELNPSTVGSNSRSMLDV